MKLQSYKGQTLKVLTENGVTIGDIIEVSKDGKTYRGVLIPRSETKDNHHIVIKLKNGYNIGIQLTRKTIIKKIGVGAKPAFSKPPLPKQKSDLPKIIILSTGGTIASRVDYRTGGVRPALTANDLYSVVPELSDIAKIKAEVLFSVFSENISQKHWSEIAQRISKHIENGVTGVVIAHGTDTIGFTAAALSFALQDLPVPVVLTGSQRSADRPSSDAATNLIGAVKAAAYAPFAEVVVAMHETISDESIVFHRGTKVRKLHTSRRDAFHSINSLPVARLKDDHIETLIKNYRKRDSRRKLSLKPMFSNNVILVKFYPGISPKTIEWSVRNGIRGVILEGTGLGHVSRDCFAAIEEAITRDVIVGMTSQCIRGQVNMNVYDTGRDLLNLGVLPLGDMLPETAIVKLMWVLGQTKNIEEAKKLLNENVANEFSERIIFEK